MSNEERSPIRVGILGVGNCAKSLVEGVELARSGGNLTGLSFEEIDGYTPADIEFVAAIDVDGRKVGKSLHQAIREHPNCAWEIFDTSAIEGGPIVEMGPVMDGVGMNSSTNRPDVTNRFYIKKGSLPEFPDYETAFRYYVDFLEEADTEILLNYLPVGSKEATSFWMSVCLEAGVSLVNCIPEFVASHDSYPRKWVQARLPLIGDDMRSQLGASVLSAVLQELFLKRGIKVGVHYQDNVGGNMDFQNMQDKTRLVNKKVSKENVIREQTKLFNGEDIPPNTIAAGPADYFPHLGDNKRAHFLISGTGFGGAPVEFSAELSVQDSPNSAGVVIDAVRFLRVARDLKMIGPIYGASAWTQKTPPKDMATADAYQECLSLARGLVPASYVETPDGYFIHETLYTKPTE